MNNIQRIQEALGRRGLDAILLTDEKNQRYAAGFPFTDGAVLVGRKKAWLLTDSRYIEAAEKTAGARRALPIFCAPRSGNAGPKSSPRRTKSSASRAGAPRRRLSACRCCPPAI